MRSVLPVAGNDLGLNSSLFETDVPVPGPRDPAGARFSAVTTAHGLRPHNQANALFAMDLAGSESEIVAPGVDFAPFGKDPHAVRQLNQGREIVASRLGIASSLFAALQAKHLDSASHSLRVTLSAASWALALEMSEEQRDVIEVASLLHDVGKIGIPDRILLKPSRLTDQERAVMQDHRKIGVQILQSSCASREVLDIVSAAGAWYETPANGDQLPLGARMLAIADAYDAMISPQVYRTAMSRRQAADELRACAGKQFDPQLVETFLELIENGESRYHGEVLERWNGAVEYENTQPIWKPAFAFCTASSRSELFRARMVDNMRDAAVFVDDSMTITSWNPGAEQMTGLPAKNAIRKKFRPSLLQIRDEGGIVVPDGNCQVTSAVRGGEQRIVRFVISNRGRRDLTVEAHVMPVVDHDGEIHGAAIQLHDVSPESTLVRQCENLQELATRDGLTKLANRAEFDRVLAQFVQTHLDGNDPCSLILCDIDYFKKINDRNGHPAGDAVLRSLGKLFRSLCRPGDLVARVGGEEFAMLCSDCDATTAARRAEELRRSWSQIAHPKLSGRHATASFGVTEIQPGDTPQTMFARSDRALYMAKDGGRNRVIQIGNGLSEKTDAGALLEGAQEAGRLIAQQNLYTNTPM
ncbi:MAG: diguanylate cyclase, partial [Pirellulales bacterium]|nr:diguanylate cyclase [Pirellulales bacterium]